MLDNDEIGMPYVREDVLIRKESIAEMEVVIARRRPKRVRPHGVLDIANFVRVGLPDDELKVDSVLRQSFLECFVQR